ncbi:hypothetical protein PTKIN_Ptkin04bG0192700 [Pterospermum kingtungense]
MADNYPQPQFVMEITVLSAENLKKPASAACCLLSRRRFRTFITITKFNASNNHLRAEYCKGDVENISFGDKSLVSIESDFFASNSCIYLQLHTKRALGGQAQLGWCHIPAADIGAPPVGSVRHLRYKLRAKDGSMGQGIVDLQVKLENFGCQLHSSGQEVIGTPVTILQPSDKIHGIK